MAAAARPSEPGAAVVGVLGRHALIAELAFDMALDRHPGAGAAGARFAEG
ncbi:hypothetical protein [Phenylobacterium sp.]|nr:hypothetical protein [Phenylobacterium sp.]